LRASNQNPHIAEATQATITFRCPTSGGGVAPDRE
jgi:hypothetical protein